ncbi:THAP domain-containing protein 9 [Elysia marginata]|uniref:THAP domain-containing protein 9 n=1 Tax=Elysia marginata TaxID=1093978 RepID=A0AAV4HME3_9GAST|nr:THAP domain-containing protein 9 [Elysia marginata]
MQLLKGRIASLDKSIEECRRENKNLKEKLRRRDTKCQSIMEKMKAEKVVSREQANILASNFGGETIALIENELKSKNTTPSTHRYSDAVKSFAVTVNFYSSQAYNYLRKFLHLPSSSTIRRWASTIYCEPGFLPDVIDKLGHICRKMVQRSKCGKCCSSLYTLAKDLPDIENKITAGLVNHKNRGGLLASNDFFLIVKATDSLMKRMQLAEKDPLAAQNKAFILRLQSAVIAEVRSKVFSELDSHFTESHYFPDSDDHGVQIIKAIVGTYTRMLMKHHAGVINERFVQENRPSLRHHLNKTILILHR